MIVFMLLAAALVVACLAWLLPPLLGKRNAPPSHTTDNLAVLREQRRELDASHAAGLIDESTYTQSRDELAERLLIESSAPDPEAPPASAQAPRRWAYALAASLPIASFALYLLLGNFAALDPARRSAPEPNEAAQVAAMVAQLAERVRTKPGNDEDELLLARSYMMLQRYAEAEPLYARLVTRHPEDAQLLVDWADAKANLQGRSLAGEPAGLIERALKHDPTNFKALALGGSVSFESGDFRQAAARWEKALTQLEADHPLQASVRERINDARARAGMPPIAAAKPTPPAASGLTLKVRVDLAAALRAQVKPDDAVFVFMRDPAGGPPLAGLRFTVRDLPLEADFAHAMRMNNAAPPAEVIIGARISKSGQPTAQAGDLQGLSDKVAANAQGLRLTIDSIVK